MTPSRLLSAFLAGALTSLAPCGLHVAPVMFVAALGSWVRFGASALALGLAVGFTIFSVSFGITGTVLGISSDPLRFAGGIGVILGGGALAYAALRAGNIRNEDSVPCIARRCVLVPSALVGIMLGAAWMPCSGPTISWAFTVLAAPKEIVSAAGVLFVFCLGAAVPPMMLGAAVRWALRSRLGSSVRPLIAEAAVAGILLLEGFLVVTGADRTLETRLLRAMPEWLVDLTIRF